MSTRVNQVAIARQINESSNGSLGSLANLGKSFLIGVNYDLFYNSFQNELVVWYSFKVWHKRV